MRLSAIRAILLALAVVFQTAAGGGLVAAAQNPDVVASEAHCGRDDAGGPSAPAGHAQHKHHCLSCPICAGGGVAAPWAAPAQILGVQEVLRLGLAPVAERAPRSVGARTQQARAPPREI